MVMEFPQLLPLLTVERSSSIFSKVTNDCASSSSTLLCAKFSFKFNQLAMNHSYVFDNDGNLVREGDMRFDQIGIRAKHSTV